MKWLVWDNLTQEEQKQATESYICLRHGEDGTPRESIDGKEVEGKSFERMDDGYVFVNL